MDRHDGGSTLSGLGLEGSSDRGLRCAQPTAIHIRPLRGHSQAFQPDTAAEKNQSVRLESLTYGREYPTPGKQLRHFLREAELLVPTLILKVFPKSL